MKVLGRTGANQGYIVEITSDEAVCLTGLVDGLSVGSSVKLREAWEIVNRLRGVVDQVQRLGQSMHSIANLAESQAPRLLELLTPPATQGGSD